ncbi:MAG: hypothetical protein CSA18_03685 [Deltaproteobacteria bacterium]|nr:MAG: hypothetical protein CSA18_03685 [Deltaproteobacteria bacterium]
MNFLLSLKKIYVVKNIIFILIFACGCFFFESCSGDKGKTEKKFEDSFRIRMIDDWIFYHGRRIVVMSLKANGKWVAQVREQEKFSRIVGKKGEQQGTWKLSDDEKSLEIIVDKGDDLDMEWTPGESYKYIISLLDDSKLVLAWEDSGKKIEWIRLRAKKTPEASSSESGDSKAPLITTKTTKMAPLIVNFRKRSPYSKDRYICTSFTIVEELETPVSDPAEMEQKIPVHPVIRDNILVYLSSLEYRELNTFKKVRLVTKELSKMISPYFAGRLKDVKLDHIIVAGSKGSFEEFIIQYPEQMARFGFESQAEELVAAEKESQ